ncbi:hypothetical protein XI02_25165 [Bradyrhizobium sp. CCBAU 21365]|nr:hypothetical protein XI02_25165 [Bradyrhizobium sp. CCBAU 21365]
MRRSRSSPRRCRPARRRRACPRRCCRLRPRCRCRQAHPRRLRRGPDLPASPPTPSRRRARHRPCRARPAAVALRPGTDHPR